MFEFERDQALREIKWRPNYFKINFVEGWIWSDGDEILDYEQRQGNLADEDIEAWLEQRDSFPGPGVRQGQKPAGFRLLVCERAIIPPIELGLKQRSYELVEETFNLSPLTLPSLVRYPGIFSKHTVYSSSPTSTSKSHGVASGLQIIVKVNHKIEIANYTLSITHDFNSSVTSGILIGNGLTGERIIDFQYESERQLDQIVSSLTTSSSIPLWSHPTFLPTVILHNYCSRIHRHSRVLDKALIELDNEVGVNYAGRSEVRYGQSLQNWPQDLDVKNVTIHLNSISTRIIFFGKVCSFAVGLAKFLLQLEDELEGIAVGLKSTDRKRSSIMVKEMLKYELSGIECIKEFFEALKERAQAQFSVLYSASAQKDALVSQRYSRLTQQIATSTKKDSIAMMTFTFITALFLPGAYVSSLLGGSMFEWVPQRGSVSNTVNDTNDVQVTGYLWVYWAITIPLTLLVMLGWWLWYRWVNEMWKKEMEKVDKEMGTSSKWKTLNENHHEGDKKRGLTFKGIVKAVGPR